MRNPLLTLGLMIGYIFLSPFLIMWVWSLFAPSVFHLPYLTWTESFGMCLFFGATSRGISAIRS